jgi:hypothetical protein
LIVQVNYIWVLLLSGGSRALPLDRTTVKVCRGGRNPMYHLPLDRHPTSGRRATMGLMIILLLS